MATTLSISGLTDYVKVHEDELFVKATVGGKSLGYAELMTNVAYKDAIPYLDSEIVLADGTECGWNPAGSDTFGEKYIETHPVEVNKEWCAKDFRKKIYGTQMQWEAGRIEVPVEQYLAESNMNRVADAVEDLVWQGNSGLSISGWINDISGDTGHVAVAFASGDTITEKVDAMVAAIPMRALKKGVNLFMSYTDFRAYVAEANASCCANKPIIDANTESTKYVGDSRINLVPVAGLEGTGKMVAIPGDGLIYGTDVENSENVYKMFMDEKTDKLNFKVQFLAGTAIRFGEEAVLGA